MKMTIAWEMPKGKLDIVSLRRTKGVYEDVGIMRIIGSIAESMVQQASAVNTCASAVGERGS